MEEDHDLEQEESKQGFFVRSLYDFVPSDQDELEFFAGDTLYVVLSEEEGWYTGYIDGDDPANVGMVPINYVEKISSPPTSVVSTARTESQDDDDDETKSYIDAKRVRLETGDDLLSTRTDYSDDSSTIPPSEPKDVNIPNSAALDSATQMQLAIKEAETSRIKAEEARLLAEAELLRAQQAASIKAEAVREEARKMEREEAETRTANEKECYDTAAAAAIKIQCSVRQSLARKKVKALREAKRSSTGTTTDTISTEKIIVPQKLAASTITNTGTTTSTNTSTNTSTSTEPSSVFPQGMTLEIKNFIAKTVRNQIQSTCRKQDAEIQELHDSMNVLLKLISEQNKQLKTLASKSSSSPLPVIVQPPQQEEQGSSSRNLDPRNRIRFPAVNQHAVVASAPSPKKKSLKPKSVPKPRHRRPTAFEKSDIASQKAANGILAPPCKSLVYPPTSGVKHNSGLSSSLELEYVHGYSSGATRSSSSGLIPPRCSNIIPLDDNIIIFPASAVVVLHSIESNTQRFYTGHNGCYVQSLAKHPTKNIIASSQVASNVSSNSTSVHVWKCSFSSTSTTTLPASAKLATLSAAGTVGILSLSFSPDGKYIVGIGSNNHHTIFIWNWITSDTTTPVVATVSRGHRVPGAVDVKFHPEFMSSISGTKQRTFGFATIGIKTVRFWSFMTNSDDEYATINQLEIANSKALALEQHDFTSIEFVTFPGQEAEGKNEGLWLTGTSYGDIYLWKQDINTLDDDENRCQMISVISAAHQTSVVSMSYNVRNTTLVSSSDEGVVKFWSATDLFDMHNASDSPYLATPREVRLSKATTTNNDDSIISNNVRCITWSKNNDEDVVMGLYSNSISIIEGKTGDITPVLQSHKLPINAIARHPVKNWYVTAGGENTLILWDAITSSVISKTLADSSKVTSIDFASDIVAVGLASGEFLIYSLNKQSAEWNLLMKKSFETEKKPTEFQRRFSTQVSNVSSRTILKSTPIVVKLYKNQFLAVACKNCVKIYEISDTNAQCTITAKTTEGSNIFHLDWSQDGRYVKAIDSLNEITVILAESGDVVENHGVLANERWMEGGAIYGWDVMGLWSNNDDNVVPTCVGRSNSEKNLIVGDDSKYLWLYGYPVPEKTVDCVGYKTHSSNVKNAMFLADDSVVISTETKDAVIFQWHHASSMLKQRSVTTLDDDSISPVKKQPISSSSITGGGNAANNSRRRHSGAPNI